MTAWQEQLFHLPFIESSPPSISIFKYRCDFQLYTSYVQGVLSTLPAFNKTRCTDFLLQIKHAGACFTAYFRRTLTRAKVARNSWPVFVTLANRNYRHRSLWLRMFRSYSQSGTRSRQKGIGVIREYCVPAKKPGYFTRVGSNHSYYNRGVLKYYIWWFKAVSIIQFEYNLYYNTI